MSLKTVTKTFPQLLVLPDVIQKGTKMLDPTTLAELEDRAPIEFRFTADMLAGQNSKTFEPSQIYQSKYDKNKFLVYGTCFNSSNVIGAHNKSISSPQSYIIFIEDNRIANTVFAAGSFKEYVRKILIYEDCQFYYFLEALQNDNTDTLAIAKYNKATYQASSILIKAGDSATGSSTESVCCYGVISGTLKLFVPRGTKGFEVVDINLSTGETVESIVISGLDNSNDKGLSSCILSSKIYNDCIYTVSSKYNLSSQTDTTAIIQKTDLKSKNYKRIKLERQSSCFNAETAGAGYSYYSSKNGTIFEKTDKEDNKYMIILNRSSDGYTYGYLTVVNGNFDLDKGQTSISELGIKQEFLNVTHFISCDENDDTLLIGDGFSIKKIKWNTTTGMFDVLSEFTIGSYQNFQLDSTGKIWVRGEDDIIRILPSQGVMLETSFDREIYQYDGEPINTFVNVSLKNQNGEYAKVDQYLYLSGPAVFTETGTNYKKISFDGSEHLTIPVTITEGGSVDCYIQF